MFCKRCKRQMTCVGGATWQCGFCGIDYQDLTAQEETAMIQASINAAMGQAMSAPQHHALKTIQDLLKGLENSMESDNERVARTAPSNSHYTIVKHIAAWRTELAHNIVKFLKERGF